MKTSAIFPIVLAALVAVNECRAADQPRSSTTIAITDATIIDGTGQPVIPKGTVLVEGDRIVAVGPSEQVDVPAGAQIVPADGRWIIPGMIDLHVHFWESARPGAQPTYVVDLTDVFSWDDEVAWVKQRIPYTLTRYSCAGVTSVVALGAIDWEYEVRELAKRTDTAPRVFIAGGLVGNYPPEEGSPLWEGEQTGYWVEHPEDAAALIARFQTRGVDLIKAGYVPRAGRLLQTFEPALEVLIREAHIQALRVSVHAMELDAAKAALRAGADILAHTVQDRQIDDEFLALAKASDVVNTSTAGLGWGFFRTFFEPTSLSEADRACGDTEVIESWNR